MLSSRGDVPALCLSTGLGVAVLAAEILASVLHEELSCSALGGMSWARKVFAIHCARERELAREAREADLIPLSFPEGPHEASPGRAGS